MLSFSNIDLFISGVAHQTFGSFKFRVINEIELTENANRTESNVFQLRLLLIDRNKNMLMLNVKFIFLRNLGGQFCKLSLKHENLKAVSYSSF